jgi:predicted PurR-regulated permease PerM
METELGVQSIRRTAIIAAALIIILAGMRGSAEVLSPVLAAWFVSMLLLPVYTWLRSKRLPTWAALLLLVALVLGVGLGILWLLRTSMVQLSNGMAEYQDELSERLAPLMDMLGSLSETAPDTDADQAGTAEQLLGFLARFLSAIGNALVGAAVTLILTVFLVLEAPSFSAKLAQGLGDNPVLMRLRTLGTSIVRYFGARTLINAGTGAAVGTIFFLIGIDYAILWGVLVFFMSYVPYIGITLATIPAVLLGWAEFGAWMAILVIIIVVVANFTAENVFAPALTGKVLSLSPTLVLVSFMFWNWMLGPLGVILSMPLTVAIVLILDSYQETQWIAIAMGMPKAKNSS